jgi:hypothetical protein
MAARHSTVTLTSPTRTMSLCLLVATRPLPVFWNKDEVSMIICDTETSPTCVRYSFCHHKEGYVAEVT